MGKYKLSVINAKGEVIAVNTFSSERVHIFAKLIRKMNYTTKIELS